MFSYLQLRLIIYIKHHQNNIKKLLKENVTKTYKKSTKLIEKSINLEAKNIAKKLDLVERVECLEKNPAFITRKDHKENFQASLPCRLINPSKSELGKVSKVGKDQPSTNKTS